MEAKGRGEDQHGGFYGEKVHHGYIDAAASVGGMCFTVWELGFRVPVVKCKISLIAGRAVHAARSADVQELCRAGKAGIL